jgi:hypothetical protein
MSRLQALRDEFLRRMKMGYKVVYPADSRHAGSINLAESIRPFYFSSANNGGHLRPSNADGTEVIAAAMASRLGIRSWQELQSDPSSQELLIGDRGTPAAQAFAGQTCGNEFEKLVTWFVRAALEELAFLRPGEYEVKKGSALKDYMQYRHLNDFLKAVAYVPASEPAIKNRLAAAFSSYAVKPDIVVFRQPTTRRSLEQEWAIYRHTSGESLLHDEVARHTPLITGNTSGAGNILLAIVSAKWTLRSDRAQNARTEGAFAVRERRGRAPNVVVVTGESKPSRIRSLTEGPDVDCVYHFSMIDLIEAVKGASAKEQEKLDELRAMNRLRDLTDLPFDLLT